MKFIQLCLTLVACMFFTTLVNGQEKYPEHEDSKVQPGVPQGEIVGPIKHRSEIFPGTVRDYWIYVPKQYDASKPAALMVVQDGIGRNKGWKLSTVMDNLIHKKEMPVTLGIFISPGVVPAISKDAQPRYNRSFEYDAMGDRYANFLLKEILPEVGKKYNITSDPNLRAIAGASSGAICAFTVAWERPDQFRRVLSTIGTYVSLRGGNEYPALIRKTENKPIRVFLQDGKNDLDLYGGTWFVANQDMLAALKFSGYDVHHMWGEGGHNSKHSAAIMPDAMRWLWREYDKPILPGIPPKRRTSVIIPGKDWELVSKGHRFSEGPAVNSQGEVFFTDIPTGRIHKINSYGRVSVFAEKCPEVNGLMFDKNDNLYACQNGDKKIVRFDTKGHKTVLQEGVSSNDIVVLPDGQYYFSDPVNKKIWHVKNNKRTVVDTGVEFPNGVITSADNSLLLVSDTKGRFIYSYQIQKDGSLKYKQPYGHLHVPDDPTDSGADGMTVDTQGRLYVATRMGIQILDQPGRVHLIINKPQNRWLSNVVFGGKNMDYLYVTCGDKVYRRKINAQGVWPARRPVKPPRPNL